MKKIALLIPDFQIGGMPVVASRLIEFLMKKYEVTLILIRNDCEIKYDTFDVRVLRVSANGDNFYQKFYLFFKRMIVLSRIFHNEKFALVISFGALANIFNSLLIRRRSIITEHNIKTIENRQWGARGMIYSLLIKVTYPLSGRIVAVSSGVKKDLEENFGLHNVITIYNPVDLSILHKQRESLSNSVNEIFEKHAVILYVGRITDTKQPLELLKIFSQVSEKVDNAVLAYAGTGDLLDKLEVAVKGSPVQNKVFILGYQKNILQLMKMALVTVLVSTNEGLPNVLIESISQGTPVIANDILAGPREILSNGYITSYSRTLKYPLKLINGYLTRPVLDNNKISVGENTQAESELIELLISICRDNCFKQKFNLDISSFGKSKTFEKYDSLIHDIVLAQRDSGDSIMKKSKNRNNS